MEGQDIIQQGYVPIGADRAFPGPVHIPNQTKNKNKLKYNNRAQI